MLFGFINISVIFQKMINEVFKEYLDIFVTIYLDDIPHLFGYLRRISMIYSSDIKYIQEI